MKKILLAAILAAVMLTGCDMGQKGTMVEGSIYPEITQYGLDTGTKLYFYAVDERTGVVYIMVDGTYRAGITAALNADGTPVTKEQFEAWRRDDERID